MPTRSRISPDEKRIVYSPLVRDFRTWKRYEGGWPQDLYVYDLATNDASRSPLAAHRARPHVDRRRTIYFASDRDGTLNLYAWDPKPTRS